jgi:hypothetical protein
MEILRMREDIQKRLWDQQLELLKREAAITQREAYDAWKDRPEDYPEIPSSCLGAFQEPAEACTNPVTTATSDTATMVELYEAFNEARRQEDRLRLFPSDIAYPHAAGALMVSWQLSGQEKAKSLKYLGGYYEKLANIISDLSDELPKRKIESFPTVKVLALLGDSYKAHRVVQRIASCASQSRPLSEEAVKSWMLDDEGLFARCLQPYLGPCTSKGCRWLTGFDDRYLQALNGDGATVGEPPQWDPRTLLIDLPNEPSR